MDSDVLGGKGAEESEKEAKTAFRCRHKWALVTRRAVSAPSGFKYPKLVGGICFVQSCRRCGCFRASFIHAAIESGRLCLRHEIRYLSSSEGFHETYFDPIKEEN